MEYRLAKIEDIEIIMSIIKDAKEYLKSQGLSQWQGEYPCNNTISQDIRDNIGYVMVENGGIIGYFVISFKPDEYYNEIFGQWLNQGEYAGIHRTAISKKHRGIGLGDYIFKFAYDICKKSSVKSLRIDTDPENLPMRKTIERNDFTFCGNVFIDGDKKVAYEKLIDSI